MSKSRHHNKNTFEEYEEERRPRKKLQDKRKERRIERALKTKNVDEIIKNWEDDNAEL